MILSQYQYTDSDGDYMNIYDVNDDGNYMVIASLYGPDNGPRSDYSYSSWQKKIISSSSNNMLVEFRSDQITEYDNLEHWKLDDIGFSASIHYSPLSSKECEKGLDMTKKMIQSPNYPDSYNNALSCKWLISVPHGSHIILEFLQFDVKSLVILIYFLSILIVFFTAAGRW